jgi:hypothetical protein
MALNTKSNNIIDVYNALDRFLVDEEEDAVGSGELAHCTPVLTTLNQDEDANNVFKQMSGIMSPIWQVTQTLSNTIQSPSKRVRNLAP